MATATRLHPPCSSFADPAMAEEMVAKAKELRPLLMAEAAEGEKRRSPTPKVDAALREGGFFKALLPKRVGGLGLSLTDFCRMQMEIAKGDLAISWVLQIINGTSWVTSLGPDCLQDAIFAHGPARVCGTYNPPGKAKKVDGGWIVNGAWPYSSGCRQAEWAQQGVVLEGEDGPVLPGISMAYIPMRDLTIQDSWFVTGMQGTGSDTLVAKDVFVPDHMLVLMDERSGEIDRTKRHFGAPSDLLPVMPVVRTTGVAQFIGGAEAMLAIVAADAAKKPVLSTTIGPRVNSGAYMRDLGEAAAQIEAAKTLLFKMLRQLDEIAAYDIEHPLDLKASHRAQSAQVITLVHSAVESLMFMAGSSAFALDKPISRYWRDIAVGLRHVINIPTIGWEIYGRSIAGAAPIAPAGAY